MLRLTNKATGVVVLVDDDTASRLSSDWETADDLAAPVIPEAIVPVKRGRPKKEAGDGPSN